MSDKEDTMEMARIEINKLVSEIPKVKDLPTRRRLQSRLYFLRRRWGTEIAFVSGHAEKTTLLLELVKKRYGLDKLRKLTPEDLKGIK